MNQLMMVVTAYSTHRCFCLGLGTISRTPNLILNYPNPIYMIIILGRKLRNPKFNSGFDSQYLNFIEHPIDHDLIHSLDPKNLIRNLFILFVDCLFSCLFDLCNNSDILILILYLIPIFTCCLMGETKIWLLIGYFGKNPKPDISGILFLGQFLVAFLDTRIFHYPNYPTRITRTPRATSVEILLFTL